MNVVVDGLIYQYQSHGGISRLYSEILPRMCNLESSLRILLLTSGRCRQPLPIHPQIEHKPLLPLDQLLRPDRLWWRFRPRLATLLQQLRLGSGKNRIWHSTYYTMLNRWDGSAVVTVHDMIHELFAHTFTETKRELYLGTRKGRCILAADAIICVSKTTKQDLQQIYAVDDTRIKVIPHAHDSIFRLLEDNELGYILPTPKPFLLYVGQRSYYKNFKILLEAYSRWPKAKDVALVVVGSPWLKEEEQQVINSGVAGYIHLLSGIDDQQLCSLYNRAIGFVYPSLYEGFGIPLLEAMACGCPIVASRIPSTVEVAEDCPIYFEPTDSDSLLAALDTLVAEGRKPRRVDWGLEKVKQYSWDKAAQQTLELYQTL